MLFRSPRKAKSLLGFPGKSSPDSERARDACLPLGIEVVSGRIEDCSIDENFFAMLLPYPTTSGSIQDYRELVNRGKNLGVRTIVTTDLLALTLLSPPGEWGADIAVGNSQRFGVPLGFGVLTPVSLRLTKSSKRFIPGRVSGFRRTVTEMMRYAWHCKPGSSIFGARRPPRTSVRRRSCWL